MAEPGLAIVRFAAVRIGTDDLVRAARCYVELLGTEPERTEPEGIRFALARGAVELVRGTPGAQALRLTRTPVSGVEAEAALALALEESFGGVAVVVDPCPSDAAGAEAAEPPPPLEDAVRAGGGVLAIDHVVVHTPDPERAIRLWRDGLGVRLALDREFVQRGLRMLFFRSAGVTLEYVSPIGGARGGDDRLNGIAYRVTDVARVRSRLLTAGFDVSPVRTGNKQGTLVATVRDGTEGVPTLLIEQVASLHG